MASSQHGGAVLDLMTQEASQRMHAVYAGVRRGLEIMAQEHEGFPTRHQEGEAMTESPRKRYSVGRHVLVGMGLRPGVVKSIDNKPSVMGEYAHLIEFDDNSEERRVLGCDMQPAPEVDQDLRSSSPAIYIHNSNVGNINLGSQIGHINIALQQISTGDESQREFARALDEFTKAVVAAMLSDKTKRGSGRRIVNSCAAGH
jgi:hypothetical protein